MSCIRLRPRLLRREHLQVLVEAMDAVQDHLAAPAVLAAAGRFFDRCFEDEEQLALYLQDADAHSQFYPWLLWDADVSEDRLGRILVGATSGIRLELLQSLIDTPADVYQVRRATAERTTLERVTDGMLVSLNEPVLPTVLAVDELLVARVLNLGDCQLLDAVHACLPTSARRGLVRAARKAERLPDERRLPMLLRAADRAMARSLRKDARLTAPDGAPIMRATTLFRVADPKQVREGMDYAAARGLLIGDGPQQWRVTSPSLGHAGATLQLRGTRLLASTSSLERADALAELLQARIPGLERSISVLQDLDGLLGEDGRSPREVRRLAQAWIDEYLTSFEDTPQRSLGGITPRQAMATSRGRTQVRNMLRSVQRFGDVAGAHVAKPVNVIWSSLDP